MGEIYKQVKKTLRYHKQSKKMKKGTVLRRANTLAHWGLTPKLRFLGFKQDGFVKELNLMMRTFN